MSFESARLDHEHALPPGGARLAACTYKFEEVEICDGGLLAYGEAQIEIDQFCQFYVWSLKIDGLPEVYFAGAKPESAIAPDADKALALAIAPRVKHALEQGEFYSEAILEACRTAGER